MSSLLRHLLQIRPEELLDLVEGNDVLPVIEVGVDRAGDDEQLLVVRAGVVFYHIGKGVLAEITGVGLLPVDHQYGAADLIAVAQDRHVEEGQRRRHIPAAVGVQTAGMVSFIISPHWNML